MISIDWFNTMWTLLADRALHWPAQQAVIIADMHFGKAAAFRASGVPVPEATSKRDLARLSSIMHATRCERLILLGDLLHAPQGRAQPTMDAIGLWRRAHRCLDVLLVRGNHDRSAGDPPESWRITVVDEPFHLDGIALLHDPATSDPVGRPAIAGHLHPCVRLRGADGSSLRAPCFLFSQRHILLPAFGTFTGGHVVQPRAGDRVFAVGPSEVLEIAMTVVV